MHRRCRLDSHTHTCTHTTCDIRTFANACTLRMRRREEAKLATFNHKILNSSNKNNNFNKFDSAFDGVIFLNEISFSASSKGERAHSSAQTFMHANCNRLNELCVVESRGRETRESWHPRRLNIQFCRCFWRSVFQILLNYRLRALCAMNAIETLLEIRHK